MNVSTRKIREFLDNTWVVMLLTILSAATGLLAVYQAFGLRVLWVVLFVPAFVGLAAAIIYSIRIRQENASFRRLPEVLHKINHDYRDVLSKCFGDPGAVPPEQVRLQEEVATVTSACQKIAQIYSDLTHVPCTVTAKVITTEPDGRAYCDTFARSESNCKRDEGHPSEFELKTEQNTAFDRALRYTPGETTHFYSADLCKDSSYRNQRQNWKKFYRSAIVVPIRHVDRRKVGQGGESDNIGFLAVDTASPNRLNGTFHVELLASFADQMYNFMSLMRGKFGVPRN
jgi:hypothetical protein